MIYKLTAIFVLKQDVDHTVSLILFWSSILLIGLTVYVIKDWSRYNFAQIRMDKYAFAQLWMIIAGGFYILDHCTAITYMIAVGMVLPTLYVLRWFQRRESPYLPEDEPWYGDAGLVSPESPSRPVAPPSPEQARASNTAEKPDRL